MIWANILVGDAGAAQFVANFGVMTLAELSTVLLPITGVLFVGTFRWMTLGLLASVSPFGVPSHRE